MREKFSIAVALMCALNAHSFAAAQNPLSEANHAIQNPDIVTQQVPVPSKKVEIVGPAETSEVAPRTDAEGMFIGAINVVGASDFSVSEFGAAIEPFVGKKLSSEDLRMLCHSVASIVRANGYSFASAYIPPQELDNGVLRVVVDEGVVSAVHVNGTSNRQLIATMNRLTGHAPTASDIERQVFLVSDIPGVTLQKISFVRENGKGVLLVDASETHLHGTISVDNNGTSELGPERIELTADDYSALIDGDVLSFAAVTTPLDPKELAFGTLRYTVPLNADGTTLSVSGAYGHTRPGADLAAYDVLGRSYDFAISINHPLLRGRNTSLWASAGFEYLVSSQDVIGVRINDDKIATEWLSLSGNTDLLRGRLRSELTITQGLPILNSTQFGDPLASRPDASANFTKAVIAAEWTGKLEGTVSVRSAARAQFASGPLLSAEQLTIGGSGFGRAFETSALAGDEGAMGLIELRNDFKNPIKWIDWAQPYIYIDGGKVEYLGGDPGGGKLLSGGGGLRTRIGKTFANLELAFPLTANPVENDDHKPRVNFKIGKSF